MAPTVLKFNYMKFGTRTAQQLTGSILVETMVATSLVAMVMASLATTSSVCMGMLRSQRETISSSQLLQERLEEIRSSGWTQVTSGASIRDNVLNTPSSQAAYLNGVVETITVTTYPPVTPAQVPLKVTRPATGAPVIISEPVAEFSLRNFTAVRVDLRVEWKSNQYGRSRSRETSTIISLGGLLK